MHLYENEISMNVNKLFILYFAYDRPCKVVNACLFVYPLFLHCTLLLLVYFFVPFYFFILTLLLYFCLFVNHVNKSIIFISGAIFLSF